METLEGALLVTCIQGAILNILIFFVMAIVYAFCRAFGKSPGEPRGFEVIPLADPVEVSDAASQSTPGN